MSRSEPAGHCALVAVDIASFGGRGDHVLRYVRKALYGLLSDCFQRCGIPLEKCYVEDRGDGAIVVVPAGTPESLLASSLVDWLRAGLRKHNELSSEVASIRLRVGLHSGEVHSDEHGIVGAAVNHVFRLLEASPLRAALDNSDALVALIVSDRVYQDVLKHAPDLVDPREFAQIPVKVKETSTTGWIRLPGEPTPREQPPACTGRVRPPSSFVGRQAEVEHLQGLVRGSRLVTLIGPGGTGKTRLAVETMHALIDGGDPVCADGAHFIDLAGYQAGDDLCRALLTGLQLATRSSSGPPASGPAADALVASLVKQRVLLLLDNCEQLLDDVAQVAETLLTRTTDTVLVTTSREALGIDGETTFPVGPLDVPPDHEDDLLGYPAVRLFVDRARAADPGFTLTAANGREIAGICRGLDGLPLPIELAAARVRALTPAQISALLADRFRLLACGSRTTPRHRTLEAVVDWSFHLLDEPARAAFVALAVFRGGFRLDEATELGSRLGIEPGAMVEHVVRLVDKSLLQATPGEAGAMRYRMLETLREYGMVRLEKIGLAHETAGHHAELYQDLARRLGTALHSGAQGAAISTLEREDDNLRAAFEFACRNGRHEIALRMVDALGWYLWMRGERVFGWPGLLRALDITPDQQEPLLRARALIWTCHLGAVGVTEPEARGHGEQAKEILERLGLTDGPEYTVCLFVGAFACYRDNDHTEGDKWVTHPLHRTRHEPGRRVAAGLRAQREGPRARHAGRVRAGGGHADHKHRPLPAVRRRLGRASRAALAQPYLRGHGPGHQGQM